MMKATNNTAHKRLGDLLVINNDDLASLPVLGIELDSRKVKPGAVFLACKGFVVDGRDYIDQAIELGAVVILADRDDSLQWQKNSQRGGVPIVVVENLSAHISHITGCFFNHPSQRLPLIGVTGTNGKTSCTQLAMQLLNRIEKSCAVIGTLGTGIDGKFTQAHNTTPDALTIQRLLSQWYDSGVSVAALEVSSHGLVQGRVAALQFDVAVLTNLTRDHLDYHGSMEAYAEAKTLLFNQSNLRCAVINADDGFSNTLLSIIPAGVNILRYSINPDCDPSIEVRVSHVNYHAKGVDCIVRTPAGEFELASPLLGEFNLSNVLAVVTSLGALGYPIDVLLSHLPDMAAIDGRMEQVGAGSDVSVIVDYAHTPDALEKALAAIRLHAHANVWCVFGCGGNRDQGKRPQMGAVAERLADYCVVTSDNPRNEMPTDIINQILSGMNAPAIVEEDRALAIELVIAKAAAGDCVLIAGKGHEQYQDIGEQRLAFSDIKQARLALIERNKRKEVQA
jgi:UDP-N-acetylmuramoyl-L-alanyl-D-glutamate--2,6-diaminopimelate ligase